jgi:hypothetical protein
LKHDYGLGNLLVQTKDAYVPHIDIIAHALSEYDGKVLPEPTVEIKHHGPDAAQYPIYAGRLHAMGFLRHIPLDQDPGAVNAHSGQSKKIYP